MAPLVHLDTHVAAWLYAGEVDRLSDRASEAIRGSKVAMSPMVVLELTYLEEIGRLRDDGSTVLARLRDRLGVEVDDTRFAEVVERAHALNWTCNPFDRLIAAGALVAGATLLSADERMREHVDAAAW